VSVTFTRVDLQILENITNIKFYEPSCRSRMVPRQQTNFMNHPAGAEWFHANKQILWTILPEPNGSMPIDKQADTTQI
jgi:hypothetical protein